MAALYLKTAPPGAGLQLDREAARLRWLGARGLPVPAVRGYDWIGDAEYLLLDEVPGVAASEPEWAPAMQAVVGAVADCLRRLHATPVGDCPFDHRVARQIEEARVRIARGDVREDDFDECRAGRGAADLFAELVATVPASEDLVLAHGDFCLPNIMLRRTDACGEIEVSGFIDCGRAGVADRYQDLALAARSIVRNHGAEWVPAFFSRYGLQDPQPAKIHFYTLLDEFF